MRRPWCLWEWRSTSARANLTKSDFATRAVLILLALACAAIAIGWLMPTYRLQFPERRFNQNSASNPLIFNAQGQGDSNPRPSVLETDALPTELYP